jgi:membrane-bound hydrogenase subunit beta
MNNEELTQFLAQRFPEVITDVTVAREHRVFGTTTTDKLVEVARALKEWGMFNIGTITGLDSGANFEVIYHFYNETGLMFNLKVFTPRDNPVIPSVAEIYPGTFLYERELMDLFGILVEGTPPSRRYPLPDDWPAGQYPLRKDWKGLSEEGVE